MAPPIFYAPEKTVSPYFLNPGAIIFLSATFTVAVFNLEIISVIPRYGPLFSFIVSLELFPPLKIFGTHTP